MADLVDDYNGATPSTLAAVFEEQGGMEGWKVTVGDKVFEGPSLSSIVRMKKMVVVQKKQPRPGVTAANAVERESYAKIHFLGDFRHLSPGQRELYTNELAMRFDCDESWIYCPGGTGEHWILIKKGADGQPDLSGLNDDQKRFYDDHMKGKPHKFLVFAVTTTPTLLNPATCHIEGAKFHPVQNGIAYVERICSVRHYKTVDREPSYKDMMINGDVFAVLMKRAAEAMLKYKKGEPYEKCCNVGIDINLSTEKTKERRKKESEKRKLDAAEARKEQKRARTDVANVGNVGKEIVGQCVEVKNNCTHEYIPFRVGLFFSIQNI